MRAALPLALVSIACGALVHVVEAPRTELVYRAAEPGDWQTAIEARTSDFPSRVLGSGDTWTVIVRDEHVVPIGRSLDWDGTLALFVPCAEESSTSGTSAVVRDLVEAETDGPHVRLYQATSVEMACTRCVDTPAALRVVARDAVPAIDDAGAAILVTLDSGDVAALSELGQSRIGAPIVIAIRRTVLSEVVLPLEASSSRIRLPIVGDDIAPLYAEFFARQLRTPPLVQLSETSRAPRSPWPEPLIALAVATATALALFLAARRIGLDGARAVGALALGLLVGALSGPVRGASGDLSFLGDLASSALEQGLSIALAALALAKLSGPRRTHALLVSASVALGLALEHGLADFTRLAHDASLLNGASTALGHVALAGVWGLALAASSERRSAIAAAWLFASVLEALARSVG